MASPSFVGESVTSSCSSLKAISRQLFMLNASYDKMFFCKGNEKIIKALRTVTQSIEQMQDAITDAGKEMKIDI